MANLKISKRHIVTLWYETQMGPMKRCMEAQAEFAEMMWALYEDMQPEIFEVVYDSKKGADEDCRKYHEEQDHIAMEKSNDETNPNTKNSKKIV